MSSSVEAPGRTRAPTRIASWSGFEGALNYTAHRREHLGPRNSVPGPQPSVLGKLFAMIAADALLCAYASGWFPMAVAPGEIRWYSPDPRGIIPLDTFHVPRRLARALRPRRFEIRVDTGFRAVIGACAEREDADGDWIDERDHRELLRAARARLRALGRDVAGRRAGRRPLRRRAPGRVLRRVDVPPRHRRVEGGARRRWSIACARAATRCSTRSG